MIKLCIIDDVHNILKKLIKDLKKEKFLTCVEWHESEFLSFPLSNEKTGKNYTYNEQVEKIYQCIRKKWNSFDVFLLDWSLYGNMDEGKNAISIAVLQKLLKCFPDFKSKILEEKKFILIVTAKNARRVDYSFEELDNKIVCVDKPSGVEKLICKSSCRCPEGVFRKPCCLYYEQQEKCDINQCLAQIINTINSILEDKDV